MSYEMIALQQEYGDYFEEVDLDVRRELES